MNRNLSTLSTLHYVYGGLVCFAGLVMLVLVGMGAFLQSDFIAEKSHDPEADLVGGVFQALGWGLFAFLEVWGALIILSGRWIAQRRNRTGSLVIAGFCCLSFPLGTALGIFTFIALLDKSAQAEYEGHGPLAAA
jgi:hypothetical protein